MGFFVSRVGLHHFIVSLAVMVIARGLCLLGTGGRPLGLFTLPPEFKFIGQGSIGPIPVVIVVFVVVVVAFDFMLRRTTLFRRRLLYRQQPEGGGLFRHPDRQGACSRPRRSARRSPALPASSTWPASARRSRTFGIGMELNVIAAAASSAAPALLRRLRHDLWRRPRHGPAFRRLELARPARRFRLLAGYHPRLDTARRGHDRPLPQQAARMTSCSPGMDLING